MILENLNRVRVRLEAAAARSGRAASEVELVAVTKTAAPEAVAELLRIGLVGHIGESRVHDAAAKKQALRRLSGLPEVRWRMVGHLQANKARHALGVFDALDSLDSLRLAQALERELADLGKTLPSLVQVKLSGRETQSGLAPEALESFLQELRRLSRIRVEGLMAIAPMLEPVSEVRPHFRRLKALFDCLFPDGGILSMGMSRDFELAVEEGATMVRVGSALFDESVGLKGATANRG